MDGCGLHGSKGLENTTQLTESLKASGPDTAVTWGFLGCSLPFKALQKLNTDVRWAAMGCTAVINGPFIWIDMATRVLIFLWHLALTDQISNQPCILVSYNSWGQSCCFIKLILDISTSADNTSQKGSKLSKRFIRLQGNYSFRQHLLLVKFHFL